MREAKRREDARSREREERRGALREAIRKHAVAVKVWCSVQATGFRIVKSAVIPPRRFLVEYRVKMLSASTLRSSCAMLGDAGRFRGRFPLEMTHRMQVMTETLTPTT